MMRARCVEGTIGPFLISGKDYVIERVEDRLTVSLYALRGVKGLWSASRFAPVPT